MVTRKFLSKIYSLLTVDGERLFYLALSSEETEEDGFFFFQCEDWSERYGIPKPTIKRYLKHLEGISSTALEKRILKVAISGS